MTLPNFNNQSEYNIWIDEQAHDELDEFLDYYEDELQNGDMDEETARRWIVEGPNFGYPDRELAALYPAVEQFTMTTIHRTEIVVPRDDPFMEIGRVVQMTLLDEVACRFVGLLEDRGYEL